MTIKELLEMKIHDEHIFNNSESLCFRIVIRVPGGWIYETEACRSGVYPGGVTSCFVPEPSSQTITPINNGHDEWVELVEPEPDDYDKTLQSEKNFLTMGRFN